MTERNYILATAGHVDHGKSALVKALTGTDPDRLPEEKARGITIDLGFAHLQLPASPGRSDETLTLGIVDVPGHEDFVKNMVAGVGAIDLAMLAVAADDGWMPQTEEHLQILEYLGVTRAVVALTKADRTESSALPVVTAELRAKLAVSRFAQAPIVPTSAVTGLGGEELKRALVELALRTPARRDLGKPRMWIDRVFTVRGAGTVVTGTLLGGSLATGQAVSLMPGGGTARIRSIQNHGRDRTVALPGTRTALNLSAVAGSEPGAAHDGLCRGMLVSGDPLAQSADTFDVWLERSNRPGQDTRAAQPIAHGAVVRLHVGTAAVACRVALGRSEPVQPGESAPAQLRLEGRLPLRAGERFVLRDAANRATLAGGVVLEIGPRRALVARRAPQLERVHQVMDDAAGWLLACLAADTFRRRDELVRALPFSAEKIAETLGNLERSGRVAAHGDWIASTEQWERVCHAATDAIANHEKAHPSQNGLPLAQLRGVIRKRSGSPGVSDAVVELLLRDGHELAGAAIRRRGFQPALPAGLEAAAEQICSRLAARKLDPPTRSDLAGDPLRTEALRFLIKTGKVVALTEEVVLLHSDYRHAAEDVGRYLATHDTATVSELKQALGSSRRVVVPLLERLDREGVTVRVGDRRRKAN